MDVSYDHNLLARILLTLMTAGYGLWHHQGRFQSHSRHQSAVDAARALPRGVADLELRRLRARRLRADLDPGPDVRRAALSRVRVRGDRVRRVLPHVPRHADPRRE